MIRAAPSPTGPDAGVDRGTEAARALTTWFATFVARELREGLAGGLVSGGGAEAFAGMFDEAVGARLAASPGFDLGLRPGAPRLPGPDASGFGLRSDPFTGELRRHQGVDIAAPVGTPIRSPRDGIVRVAGEEGSYGNLVVLDHGDGTETRLAHCDTIAVRPGQAVRAGDEVATVGATGRATGPHLHLELRVDGRAIDPSSLAPFVLRPGERP